MCRHSLASRSSSRLVLTLRAPPHPLRRGSSLAEWLRQFWACIQHHIRRRRATLFALADALGGLAGHLRPGHLHIQHHQLGQPTQHRRLAAGTGDSRCRQRQSQHHPSPCLPCAAHSRTRWPCLLGPCLRPCASTRPPVHTRPASCDCPSDLLPQPPRARRSALPCDCTATQLSWGSRPSMSRGNSRRSTCSRPSTGMPTGPSALPPLAGYSSSTTPSDSSSKPSPSPSPCPRPRPTLALPWFLVPRSSPGGLAS